MKKLLIALSLLSISNIFAAPIFRTPWTDSNGAQWIFFTVKGSHATALRKCHESGYHLPTAENFWEALDLGLIDPKTNTVFGKAARKIDWVWIQRQKTTPSFAWMASKWEDIAEDEAVIRHWIVCVKG